MTDYIDIIIKTNLFENIDKKEIPNIFLLYLPNFINLFIKLNLNKLHQITAAFFQNLSVFFYSRIYIHKTFIIARFS